MGAIKIIAFDQSTTKTGYCVMNHKREIIDSGVIVVKGKTIDRIRTIIKKCLGLADKHAVNRVYIEGVQYQKNAKVFEILAKLSGTLEVCFIEAGYETHVIKSSEWRRRAGIKNGKRQSNKKQAIELTKKLYDIEPSEDECEAICFALAFAKEDL